MYKKIIALLFVISASIAFVGCDDSTVETQTQAVDTTTISTSTEAGTQTETITDLVDADIDFDDGFYEDYTSDTYTILNGDSESYEITVPGTYVLEGTITETVVINVLEDEDVRLILNNVTISPTTNSGIAVLSADDVEISVPEGTSNYVSDSETYTDLFLDYDAAIYSEEDLVINGTGTLEVTGNYNNAIQSKDDLMICDVTLDVTSVDDGIIGRDSLLIQNATITTNTDGDSLKATNDEKTDEGFIYIESGVFNFTTGSDALDAANYIVIVDGEFTIEAESNALSADTDIYISGGTFSITTVGDSIKAELNVFISGGTLEIDTEDDAIKAGTEVTITGGTINITACYEGLEAPLITIDGGTITIVATDDAVNAADGTGGVQGGTSQTADVGTLYVNGGLLTLSADGDCLDVNGTIYITGGEIYAYGLSDAPDSAIDYNIACYVSGGVIFGVGSSRMAMAPEQDSEQASIMIVLSSDLSSGSLVTLSDSEGNVLFQATTQRDGDNIVISTPELTVGEEYNVTIDGVMDLDYNQETTVTYLDEYGVTEEHVEENPGNGGGFPPTGPGAR